MRQWQMHLMKMDLKMNLCNHYGIAGRQKNKIPMQTT
jgi:hypothetical protein